MTVEPVVSARALVALADVVLLDCRANTAAYRAGHVAGAHHAQLERDLSAPGDPALGGRHPLPDASAFAATLGRWGVTPGARVVAYDDQSGANAAARLWWMVKAIGHDRVQVVDGGLAALVAAGFELTSDEPTGAPQPPYPRAAWLGSRAEIDEVDRARLDPARRVIDVRAVPRFRGDTEPFDPIAGHIPGALNAPYADNLRPDGTFKTADELRAHYAAVLGGIAPDHAIVHCGSGVTACHTLLALDRAGLSGARLYVGSWSEWCRDPARPREPAGKP